MKTHKFARKPFYIDAVRVSEANIEEVAVWCEGEVETDSDGQPYIRVTVHRPLTERQTQAYIGDWVLFAGSGFKVYTPKAFDKSFEKVRHLTKEQADAAGITVPHEKRSTKPGAIFAKPGDHLKKEPAPQVDYRDAGSGQYITEEEAEANPGTTVKETSEVRTKADVEADALIAEVLSDDGK